MTKDPILLDRNENQYGPAPSCFEVLREARREDLSSYSRDYEKKIKSKLSQRLAEIHKLPEERILLSYGSEDMLKQAVHCYLRAGEKILIPNLSWWYYKSVAEEVNGITLEYPLYEGSNSYVYDVEEMLKLMKEVKPQILLVASPNNPTGNCLSNEGLETLLAENKETLIILDEAYWGFSRTQSDETPRLLSTHNRLLILRTFSKYYALAGVRIGYACAGEQFQRLERFSARYLGYNLLSEKLALAALESEEYYSDMRLKLIRDRELYARELNNFPAWKAYESEANFLLASIPQGTMLPLKSWLEERDIKIKFYDTGPLHGCVRITIGREEQNRALIGALKEFIGQPAASQSQARR